MSIYTELQDLIDDDPDEVVRRCMLLLNDNPDDSLALFLMGIVYSRAERFGMAVKTPRTESFTGLSGDPAGASG